MANYIPYNLNQTAMVVINFADQLQPGTFEYALAYLIDRKIDLSLFDEGVVNDGGGRRAYDPAILSNSNELETYLDDIYHEYSSDKYPNVKKLS